VRTSISSFYRLDPSNLHEFVHWSCLYEAAMCPRAIFGSSSTRSALSGHSFFLSSPLATNQTCTTPRPRNINRSVDAENACRARYAQISPRRAAKEIEALNESTSARRALHDLRIIDMSRVLAGPWATQLLADLGADVIKVERPGTGDDTRAFGPPWFQNEDGAREAAYFTCANRNKRSIALDITQPADAALVAGMASDADVFVENFKVGSLARYGLDYETLAARNPRLIYCSITGFGQHGRYAALPGYDFIVQAIGGLMSVTGEPEGSPMKVGVALADILTGLYACSGILAALHQRSRSGRGQLVELALLDVQVAALANQAASFLAMRLNPERQGNAHPSIVPYQTFETADGVIAVAVGNDAQFASLCAVLESPALAADRRFRTNASRVAERNVLIPELQRSLRTRSTREWLGRLAETGVPAAPVNTLEQVFSDPHVIERRLEVSMPHASLGSIPGVACPVRMSDSPAVCDRGPPVLDEHGEQIRQEMKDRRVSSPRTRPRHG
jgi:crotonobetainyl-CoA:carnitine CoA-transferase CaiB-like acyl-CoA transferase